MKRVMLALLLLSIPLMAQEKAAPEKPQLATVQLKYADPEAIRQVK